MRFLRSRLLWVTLLVVFGCRNEPAKDIKPDERPVPGKRDKAVAGPRQPFPLTEITAWKKDDAAMPGWLFRNRHRLEWRSHLQPPEPEDIPSFQVFRWERERLANLPAPQIPFGLWFCVSGAETTPPTSDLLRFTNLRALQFELGNVSDDQIRTLKELNQLEILVIIDSNKLTDDGAKEIASFKELKILGLERTVISNLGLMEIAGLRQLQALDLTNTRVSDEGIEKLAVLTELRALGLRRTGAGNKALEHLLPLRKLESLDLRDCPIQNTGLRKLGEFSELRYLDLIGTLANGSIAKELAKLTKLRELHIENVSDDDLLEITNLKELRVLTIQGKLTAKGLRLLPAFEKLRELDLSNSLIPVDEGIKELARIKGLSRLKICGTPVTDYSGPR